VVSTGKIILVVLATMVIFATGVVTGGILVRTATRPAAPSSPAAVFHRFEIARRAVNQIDLAPEQRARIERVIRESQDRIADYFQILEPDITDAFRQMRENIRAELTPEQRKQFDERMQQLRRINERRSAQGSLPDRRRSADPQSGPGRPDGPAPRVPTPLPAPQPKN
jgi:Spy/CpxP family protein refolding chaperone